MEDDYIEINKKLWNDKTDVHFASDFYDVESFVKGKKVLKEIELELLDSVKGKSILHLQCHFGQDTIDLSRMGAKAVGVDLSDKAIDKAKTLAKECGTDTKFVCCDVYNAPNLINEKFDIVFTSFGTIGWLPNMTKWAQVVNHFLKPGGKFVFAEFHPVIWMMNYDFSAIEYPYFNRDPIIEENEGTYADQSSPIKNKEISWNHSMSEVVESLLSEGLILETLREFDYSPHNCFKNTVQIEQGKFQIIGLEGVLPMVYSLRCGKPE